jgi:hypothetical protein
MSITLSQPETVGQLLERLKTIKVYTSVSRFKKIGEDGVLTGGSVLPGFSLAVKEWLDRAGKRG